MVVPRAIGGVIAVAVMTSTWLAAWGGGDSPELTVPLARAPYLGVSCDGRPNWIGCDRVGLFVWLNRDVAQLTASIDGREVPMRRVRRGERSEQSWEGFLRPAGLIDGPLRVRPDRGRYYWYGRKPVSGRIRVTVVGGDGKSATSTLRVPLAAGYG